MIYLVHFEKPLKHAKHYIGFTDGTLRARFARHRSLARVRRGSALMRAVMEAGIAFKVVRTWPGDRDKERRIKVNGHSSKRCPVCLGEVSYNDAVDLLASEAIAADELAW